MHSHQDEQSAADFKEKKEALQRFIAANSAGNVKLESPKKPAPQKKEMTTTTTTTRPAIVAETTTVPPRLSKSVQEFFTVQQRFHTEMAALSAKLNSVVRDLPESKRIQFAELLSPYTRLAENPFQQEATGDLEKDIAHILSVVNSENAKFKQALSAFLDSAANLKVIKSQLERMKADKKFANTINKKIGSWLQLEGRVDQPFQNVIRYELLLKAIQKELVDAGYLPTEEALDLVMRSIERVVPELKKINKYRELVQELNKIDVVLLDLYAYEVAAYALTYEPNDEKTETMLHIQSVHFTVMKQKNKIANGEGEDTHDFLKALLDLLRAVSDRYIVKDDGGIVSRYVSYVKSSAYNVLTSVPHTLFSSSLPADLPAEPVQRLKDCISDLETMIEHTEIIRDMFKRS